jgi:parallel beta-helix repeat protein
MTYQGFWKPTNQSGCNRDRVAKPAITCGLVAVWALASGVGLLSASAVMSAAIAAQPVAQIPAAATVLHVNPATGQDTAGAGVSAGTPYRTITYALKQAKSGNVIRLARGTYTTETGEVFPLDIPNGVTLVGEEAEKGRTVAIIGGGVKLSPSYAGQNMTIWAPKTGAISGVAVTNPNTRGTGIWIEEGSPTVTNCTFKSNNREGIFVSGSAEPKITNNEFTQNGGNGISIATRAKGEIRNNLFQNTGFGLAIGGGSAPLVVGNRIIENTDGLYINDGARPILRNNVIENNKRDGIVATISAKPDLGNSQEAGNNVIRGNRQFDLNNSTREPVYSVGNTLDAKRVRGQIAFVAPPTGGGSGVFADVQGHWAVAYIEALAKRDIISGFPGGVFKPDDLVTRAQFAAIISKAFTPAPKRPIGSFGDINTGFWAYQPIQTSVQGGFMSGYPEGVFRPNQQIPRVQVLVALANGLTLTASDPNVLFKFQDATAIPGYAAGPVAAATERKIVVNYPSVGVLNPNREATRAEVAAFVYQALVNAGKAEAIQSPYIVQVP